MGLRCLLYLLTAEALLWGSEATSVRRPRQAVSTGHSSEPKAYQPPISLGAPSAPIASSASLLQNSYQPPISLIRSNEYQSPLNPHTVNAASAPRSYQSQPPVVVVQNAPQTYVLPSNLNQPQQHHHQSSSHSVQYVPPTGNQPQHSFSVFQQSAPQPNSFPQTATSYSVHQQPSSQSISQGQSTSFGASSSLPQGTTAERTYSTHSKVVASHVPAQAIHKAPASEIQSDKGPAAKEKDKNNDEYVVYYYYYYDNDTAANNNLSLNFDDIPSLEAYDGDKQAGKEPDRSSSARTLAANVNSLTPSSADKESDTGTGTSSQPRSVGDVYGRPGSHTQDDTLVQPLKPISNVFRYGSNEVPRFPVLPNFIVTEVPTTTQPEAASTPDTLPATEPPTTQPSHSFNDRPDLKTGDEADDDDDDSNNVLDINTDLKSLDDKNAEEEQPTTTTSTTTTTEPPTTTEEPTTTTERPSRRRPSLGAGGRRRFNPSPSFSSGRNRQTPSSRSTTSSSTSTTTSTTTSSTPTRRTFQGNRIRPRPSIGGSSNRPRAGSRTTEERGSETTTAASASSSTTTGFSRSRFSSAAPRRFQSSRSRSSSSSQAASSSASSTTSTTTTTRSPISRSRPTSRPRPNLISRNRPPRPGFLRPRPGSLEPEEPETTTPVPAPTEETSPETDNDQLPSTNNEDDETDEDNETSVEEETEEPTTTEGSRFSALFRPRNRNALGNRPRPVIGNRPSRS